MNQESTPPFWGVFREVFGVRSKIWPLEVPFFGTPKVQKCPFSSAKKWHFERPNLRTDSKNLAKHPPKWWGRHLVHAFPFLGEYQANFWKLPILGPSGALFPLPRTPNLKWLAQWHLWVYKFETCFLGSPNPPKHTLRVPKKNSKILFFWPTLMGRYYVLGSDRGSLR